MLQSQQETRPNLPRIDGRQPDELRPIKIDIGYLDHAEGSALISLGKTVVLCAVSVEDRQPAFLIRLLLHLASGVQHFGLHRIAERTPHAEVDRQRTLWRGRLAAQRVFGEQCRRPQTTANRPNSDPTDRS